MSVMGWIKQRLIPSHKEEDERLAELLSLTDQIHDASKRLNRKMAIYAKSRDPFAALLADVYNQRQLKNVYKGEQPSEGEALISGEDVDDE